MFDFYLAVSCHSTRVALCAGQWRHSVPIVLISYVPDNNLSNADRLILEAATASRHPSPDELQEIIAKVAGSRFNPAFRERVGGRIAGLSWQGRTLRGGDTLPPVEVHYLRHVIARREWPEGATLDEYIESIQEAILSPNVHIFTSLYGSEWQLGIIVPSDKWRGPHGGDWIVMEYRLSRRHPVTAYQKNGALDEVVTTPHRSNLRWLPR